MLSSRDVVPPERYYRKSSSGAPLVLIHGLGGTWRNWEPVLPLLEPSCSILAPTLVGHWGGGPPGRVWPTVDAMADDIESLMDGFGLGKAHVVGHSLGSSVALELFRRGRAVSVLALCPGATWSKPGQRAWLLARLTATRARARLIAPQADRLLRRRWIRRSAFRSLVEEPETLAPSAAAMLVRGTARCPTYSRTIMSLGMSAGIRPLPGQRRAVRVVWAGSDRIVPMARFRESLLERIGPVAETIVWNVGHLLMFEDPHRVARLVLDGVLAAQREDRTSEHGGPGAPDGSV